MKRARVRSGLTLAIAIAALAPALGAAAASAAPVFTPLAAEMSERRYMPDVATLPDGKVLIAGGYTGKKRLTTAELFDPASGKFEALAAEMAIPRAESATITLPNGKVLIAGGYNETEFKALKSAELFNPETSKFEATGELAAARDAGVAALLPNGKVLLAGGEGEKGLLTSTELYDPETGKFEAIAAKTSVRRYAPIGATLPDGKVLVAGGEVFGLEEKSFNSAELFNPASKEFEGLSATMATGRGEAGAAPLANGEVLVVGGFVLGEAFETLASTEVFNQGTLAFEQGFSLGIRRDGPAAALLHDGRVLIVGGASPLAEGYEYLKSAELASPGPPTVTTGAPAAVSTTTATLNGSVRSPEATATAYFQYGTSTAYGAATAPQAVAASLVNPLPVASGLAGLVPGTTYHFRVVGEVGGHVNYGADQTFTTVAAVKQPPPREVTPTISKASQSASRWREGKALARISRRRAPLGDTFSFTLSTQATVSFRFTQAVAGRRVGRRCVARSRRNARRRACRRTVTAGALSFAGHAGANQLVFQGRLSAAKKLRPGRYTLTITARNAAGRSNAVRLIFTIVK